MVPANSLDEIELIAAILCSVQTLHSEVIDQRSIRLDIQKIKSRTAREGLGFLTKTLPRLGKAFDRALSGDVPLNANELAFKSLPDSQLPIQFGMLFQRVFSHDGWVLPTPCVDSIKHIRTLCYLFYKYEVPYTQDTEQTVLSQFLKTEEEIRSYDETFNDIADEIQLYQKTYSDVLGGTQAAKPDVSSEGTTSLSFARRSGCSVPEQQSSHGCEDNESRPSGQPPGPCFRTIDNQRPYFTRSGALSCVFPMEARDVIRRARKLLNTLFLNFDPTDIVPRHGPGAVSTKEKLWGKYFWSSIPDRLANVFPIDSYFYASLGHVCDAVDEIRQLRNREDYAQVILVPKDSRGPRLISCEPLVFQWIQQGLGRSIVRLTERHWLTADDVHFTDQQPNRMASLLGSRDGRYSTLDLSEASDRVTVGLVRLLFPDKVQPYLLAARSLGTTMPDGSKLTLRKYAPMGSALCFPILALTVWSLLRAGLRDAEAKPSIKRRPNLLVYGDDVIVPTAHAENAINLLTTFGLKINHVKSNVSGFFRESCGLDAYKGIEVTPVRIRTKIPSRRSPGSYSSWIAYANQMWDRKYFKAYELIVRKMLDLYGQIPSKDLRLGVPSLYEVPNDRQHFGARVNQNLQKMEYKVYSVRNVDIKFEINGWKMLLRYFTSGVLPPTLFESSDGHQRGARSPSIGSYVEDVFSDVKTFSASSYTKRSTSKLVRRWR